jgi:DNA mismatch repair protein MutL
LFVNGRWIQDKSLAFAVAGAYATLLPKSRYPVAVLWIQMDRPTVDVNVHPAKAEVRFRNPDAVFSAVRRAVAGALGSAPVAPARDGLGSSGGAWEPGGRRDDPRGGPRLGVGAVGDRWALTAGAPWLRGDAALIRESGWSATGFGAGTPGGDARGGEERPDAHPATFPQDEKERRGMAPLRPLGQVGLTYLVAESADGLVLIDQHAAHERVLYEALMGRHGDVAAQGLLVPAVVELAPSEMDAFEAYGEALRGAGFDVEPFGAAAVAVRAVPDVTATGDPAELLRAVLDGLDGGADLVAAAVHERIASIVCKRASVKAGQTLSLAEARALIEALEATASPRTCPHGRPTMVAFSRERLEREFGRT